MQLKVTTAKSLEFKYCKRKYTDLVAVDNEDITVHFLLKVTDIFLKQVPVKDYNKSLQILYHQPFSLIKSDTVKS